MPYIKIALIGSVLWLLIWAFRNRRRVSIRASIRLGLLALAGFAIISVAYPSITTSIAHAMGVQRGTDLLLYTTVVAFGFTSVGLYFRSRELQRRIDSIFRILAVSQAVAEQRHSATDTERGDAPAAA